jgi:flagellar motor switch protein FliN/FliY
VASLLEPAAAAAAANLLIGEPVETGPLAEGVEFAVAVLVPFSGSSAGEIAVFVDQEVIGSLTATSVQSVDLTVTVRPALDALAAVIGQVTLGVAQQADGRLAHARIANHADSGSIQLTGATGRRAAIGIGIDAAGGAERAPAVVPQADRLDLLRGVEMQATAELGRARMTINQLLSLQTGAVIELDRAAGDPADIFVNGRLIARGEVVVVDENYGLRITQIVADENGR